MTPTRFLLPQNSRHLGLLQPLPITTTATVRCTVPTAFLNLKFSTTTSTPATPLPVSINWHGPPPEPPVPRLTPISEFRARQRKAVSDRAKRFWKEVHVVETSDGYTINLDNRPLKTPQKAVLLIPTAKPLLAHGIAVEWANFRTSSDALKSHRVPLTQMASRAIDLSVAEAAGEILMRGDIMQNLIRYIDTDTVLCWAPTTPAHLRKPGGRLTLRELQIAACDPLLAYLGTRVWPGIDLRITDGDQGIFGAGGGQLTETKNTLMTWMKSLDVWRLVGLERIVHATKSFVIGARMVAEWSESGDEIWGIKEAAEAASIEVTHQTRQWGEVEDTHDVQKEDLLRQVGAGWVLICGEGNAS